MSQTTDAVPSSDALPGSALLQGFDTFAGTLRSTALKGIVGSETIQNLLQYRVCSSTESLYRELVIPQIFGNNILDAPTFRAYIG